MTEPTWREIRDLTRLRRKQAATVRYGVAYDAERVIAEWVADDTTRYDHGLLHRLWNFQCGRCYMCAVKLTRTKRTRATREHVRPRSKGHGNENNLLLACADCNNAKGDREPTSRELAMLNAWLAGPDGDRLHFVTLMLTAESEPTAPPPSHTVSAKRQAQNVAFERLMREARQRRTGKL